MKKPTRKRMAGILLACVWNLSGLLLLNVIAIRAGWWSFHAKGGLFLGIPVDFYLGWIVLWGMLPELAMPRWRLLEIAGIAFGFDLIFMPLLKPVLQLGPRWLIGEFAGIVFCLLPSFLFSRWTRDSVRLQARTLMQVIAFTALILEIIPAIVLANTGGDWTHFPARPNWINLCLFQLLAVPSVIGLSAVYEFVQRGRGTPLPYDPPTQLVGSGPYAYVANPMQLSAAVLLAGWGLFLGSVWVCAAGVMAHIYSVGLAAWDEGEDLSARFGSTWIEYRKHVRNWMPRWRPWHASKYEGYFPARLYVAESCGACSQVKEWFEQQSAIGLQVIAAELYPGQSLFRITYDPCDGNAEETGVAAIARAIEHINFAFAFCGWVMRLPMIRPCLQLLIDASGGHPRSLLRVIVD
ncbi:MAG TPA: methyltransferase [Terriglobales bacterium]|nr:methyltransferase [Terriglobales bacterium]